jgi:iron uptake system EfeUOB component EfeO/EfeM
MIGKCLNKSLLPAGWPHRRMVLLCTAFAFLLLFVPACGSQGSAASDPPSPQSEAAIAKYGIYLEKNDAKLVHWAKTLVAKLEEGTVKKAQSRYSAARVPFGHIAPILVLFPDLDSRIDGHEGGAARFTGFHRLEKALFLTHVPPGSIQVAKQLLAGVEDWQRRMRSAQLRTGDIAKGADRLIHTISSGGIAGNEEPYSHIDLTDMAAETEGLEAAFEALKPALAEEGPKLTKAIEDRFERVYAEVGEWGVLAHDPEQIRAQEPGVSFVLYNYLSQAVVNKIASQIRALADLFSQAQAQLDGSS